VVHTSPGAMGPPEGAHPSGSSSSVWSSLPSVPDSLRAFARSLDARRCPAALVGTWRIDARRSESLCPFVVGLGVPKVACPAIGLLERTTELTISCPAAEPGEADRIVIEDKTALSARNVTAVTLDGAEVERATKTGRRRFMLSGATRAAPTDPREAGGLSSETAVVTCRLFQRGPGWATRQERALVRAEDGAVRLRERNVLTRPNEPDVVVDRFFRRKEPEADAG